jgi:SAM-dependent methyltransferase
MWRSGVPRTLAPRGSRASANCGRPPGDLAWAPMSSTLPKPPDGLDPDQFAAMGAGFMSAKLLCVGAELGVFEWLGDGPRTLEELCAKSGLPRRSLRVVVNGLCAIGVLERDGDRYANGASAQAYLAGRTSVDLRAGLRLYNHVIYPMWMQFEDVVRSGAPARHGQPSETFARIFSEGVEAWTGVGARALPSAYDFTPHRRILDVGGGTGSYLVPLLEQYPALRGTLYELPPSASVARRRLAEQPVLDRIEIVEGDALVDPLPEGHDVVLLAGFIHLLDPDKIEIVLSRIRAHVEKGMRLLIVDQWMDATHTQPVFGAMLAATYLLISGDGDTYSVGEAEPWLTRAGFRVIEHRPLAGVTSLLVAEAV